MADYLEKMEEGLVIAKPEIVLPWNLKKVTFSMGLTAFIW